MLNVSKVFRRELHRGNRDYLAYADVILMGGKDLPLDDPDIMEGGISVDDAVSSDSSFDIGAAIINKCTLTLNNIYEKFSEYDFTNARVVPYVGLGLPDGTVERVRKGTFTVDDAKQNGSVVTLTCLDNMAKFDKPYSLSSLAYPATLGVIVRDACDRCGVTLQTYDLPHKDYVVDEKPDGDRTTFREVISWAAQIAGCFCRCDVYGRLELKWYDQEALELPALDGGSMDPWTAGDKADGGTFKPWSAGTAYDAGVFGDRDNIHHISSLFSQDIAMDDVVITGVRVVEKAQQDGKDVTITHQSGKEGYVLSIEGNELIQGGSGQKVAGWIGERLIGFRFRRASVSHLNDPTIEAGDVGLLSDRKGNTYRIVISSTKFQIGATQSTSCSAKTPARNSATRFSAETKNYVDYRKGIEKERTDREKALIALKQRVDESPGLFTTEEVRPDGGSVFYLHDKPLLEDSMAIWIMTKDAWGVSTDGGKTLNAGMTVDGDLITRILTATGVNADWVKAGALRIEKDGKTLVDMDFDKKSVTLMPDRFTLSSGETIEDIAQAKAEAAKKEAIAEFNDFISTVYDPKIAELQKDIDGQIETWYYDYEPTLSNIPASGWKTEADRAKHEGDLFYWKTKGYSYRFLKDRSTWKWQLITDSDITKALADAAKAKDTADNKRRIFVVQPTPPYDKGDLWTQGKDGDIKVCNTARASGSYVSSDWVLASNYIDASKVPEAWADEKTGASQDQVLKKLTNNFADKGIYLQNGKLYISFNAARGGELTLGGANNGYGLMRVLDAYDKEVVTADRTGLIVKGSGTEEMRMNSQLLQFWYDGQLVGWGSAIGSSGINLIGHKSDKSGICRVGGDLNYIDVGNNKVLMIGDICCVGKKPNGSSYRDNPAIYSMSDINATPEKRIEFNGGQFQIIGGAQVTGSFRVAETLTVSGSLIATSKSNLVKTQDYDDRLLYCYEMPSPMYGDIGEGETDADGVCCIFLDDVFTEAIAPGMRYQVFLQKEGPGDLWVGERQPGYFVVKGTPGLKFAWEVKARQKGQECTRLELFDGSEPEPGVDYEQQYADEYQKLIDEREVILYETAL